MTKELVLGYCDYTWEKSAPFVKSLRQSGYQGDIVFLRGTSDPYTIQKYEEWGVCTYSTSCLFDFDDAIEFLNKNKERYEQIFSSDVRDVIFQDNPFYLFTDYMLHLFEEDLTIGQQNLNSHWIRAGYGQKVLDMLKDKKIINAGAAYGGMNAMLDFYQKMKNKIASEQATLDYLYYMDEIRAVVHPNDGSMVWNIGTKIDTEHDDFYAIDGYHIRTLDNYWPCVIHQYDRHPRIAEMIRNYYAD